MAHTKQRRWPRIATLTAAVSVLGLGFAACDHIGIGPNLGLPFGYYGRFNKVLAKIQTNPDVEVIRTTLHRDNALEDFYITVRTRDDREIRLRFEEAHTRPFGELLEELKRVGI